MKLRKARTCRSSLRGSPNAFDMMIPPSTTQDSMSARLMAELRDEFETPDTPCMVSCAIGPRGDGYKAGNMDAGEAEAYHSAQIESFARTEADMVAAYTLTNLNGAIGIARAAAAHALPCVTSFTVETDGRLEQIAGWLGRDSGPASPREDARSKKPKALCVPIGMQSALATNLAFGDAINRVDDATAGSPIYYMINCAHPTHLLQALEAGEPWLNRIRGVRANASAKSHAELDESETLDAGDPVDLGRRYRALRRSFPTMRILGACCGTDHPHIVAICEAFLEPIAA